MKVFVTGAAGFIGSHLCDKLIELGHQVIGVDDLSSGKLSNLDGVIQNKNFHFLLGSIINGAVSSGEADLDDIDWFFHLAAKADIVPSIERPVDYHNTNVNGTVKSLEIARKLKAKKFIYAASSSCYGIPDYFPTVESDDCNPQYPYALTKYVGEQYVLHWAKIYGLKAISLRLFNVFGPRSRTSGAYGAVFGVFLSQLANGYPLTVVGDGKQSRDFTYVSDVVDAFIRSAESNEQGVFNVGSGGHYSINHLLGLLGDPATTALPKRPGEPDKTFASIGKIRSRIGWAPKVKFEEGVERMKAIMDHYKSAPLWTKEKIEMATKPWFEALS